MNYSNYRLTFDIHDIVSNAVVKVKRGDNTRRLCISLTENGKVYQITEACTAVFKGKKPDGYSLYNACTIEDNCILYVIGNNTTSAVGVVESEISLIGNDGETITSPRFSILVEDTIVHDGDIFDSSDEASALVELVAETSALKDEMETKLANGEFDGVDGKSAYEYAQGSGYTGTETEFAKALAGVPSSVIRGTASGTQIVRLDNASDVCPALVTLSGTAYPNTIPVKRYGKNLLPYPYAEKGNKTVNGITFTDNGDGTITANGTATTADAQYKLTDNYAPYLSLPPGTYTFSGGINGRHIHLNAGGTIIHENWVGQGNKLTVTFAEGDVMQNLYCTVKVGETVTNKMFYPMIELSTVETDYEPYAKPESYTPGTDGTVDIPLLPTTTLMTDTAGVTISTTYTQDATGVVASLMERIAALETAVASS